MRCCCCVCSRSFQISMNPVEGCYLQSELRFEEVFVKAEVSDETDVFEEHKTDDCGAAVVRDAYCSHNQKCSYSAFEASSVSRHPGTEVEYCNEGSDNAKADRAADDSRTTATPLSAGVSVCELCDVVPVDCKCWQHHEAARLSGSREDVDSPATETHQHGKCACNLCGKSNATRASLTHRTTICKRKQTFGGKMCRKPLSRGKVRKRKRFNCRICRKSFINESDRTRHIRSHSGQHTFSCELCNKSFIFKSDFDRHSRTHSGCRPFSCELCSKSFSQKSHLVYHNITHTGERPFSCEQCNKSFSFKSSLARHKRTHSGLYPFSCEICSKLFRQKGHLTFHRRTHTGERPFICDQCSKSFNNKSNLIRHSKTHFA